ncbi:MAG: MarR family transcriptional regulator [Deltaproteobacteria bacterium]|nr:MarR family transcriptional regulator [Deltaproteobacteria bacterium]
METLRQGLQVFVRRFGLLQASCCEACCGENVSLAQSHILLEIRRLGSPAMQRVADELGIDITTFSRQAKALAGKGLILRRVSPHDGRVTLLELTDEGLKVLERIDLHMNERMERFFSHMTPFERNIVTHSLDLLSRAVANPAEGDAGYLQQATKSGCICG